MMIMQSDVWLMGCFLEKSDLGIYNVAMRFTLPLTIALGALSNALWPRTSGTKTPVHLLKKVFGLTAMLSCFALIYSLFAPYLSSNLFGVAYEKSRLIGQVLCLRYSIAILVNPLVLIGYSFGLVRVYWIINSVQLLIVVLCMLSLLPVYGPVGAALALLIMELIGSLFIGIFILTSYAKYKRMKKSTKD